MTASRRSVRRAAGVAAHAREIVRARSAVRARSSVLAPAAVLVLTAVLALAAVLVLAAALSPTEAHAAAGGGSSAFSGGGGGGGFSGGHGHGAGLYILFQLLFRVALLGHGAGLIVLVALGLLAYFYFKLAPRARDWMQANAQQGRSGSRKTAERERRTELAAAEAADQDESFDPENVRSAATQLWLDVQRAWDERDRARLRTLVDPSLYAEWERRLDDFDRRGWHNRVQPLEPPAVHYVGLTNAANGPRTATVKIEARLRDYVEDRSGRHIKRAGRATETVRTREFWTLTQAGSGRAAGSAGGAGRADGGATGIHWRLASIEQGAEGTHQLSEALTPTAWSDSQQLQDESLLELTAQETPRSATPGELAPFDLETDAHAAAMDLSVADPRFSPDVIATAARAAAKAWALAVDGGDEQLNLYATAPARAQLLHPNDPSQQTRLVVRGPKIEQITVTGLDPHSDPPTLDVAIKISGRRYIEDRDTARILSGDQNRSTTFTEHWTLALTGDPARPWRITAAGARAAA